MTDQRITTTPDGGTRSGGRIAHPTGPLGELLQAASYAVVDFRMLADEAGERDPRTSPALRAADRLAAALGALGVRHVTADEPGVYASHAIAMCTPETCERIGDR